MSSRQSLSYEHSSAPADVSSIYRDSLGNLWVSFEPCYVPDGGPEFLTLEANSTEFSSLITYLKSFKVSSTPFCASCYGLGGLLETIASLRYNRVKVLLGSLQHVRQKAYCSSCCSILADVATKKPDVPLELAISIPTRQFAAPLQLVYCNNVFATNQDEIATLNPTSSTCLYPTKPLFPDEKYGRAWTANAVDLLLVKSWIEKCNSHSKCSKATCHFISLKPAPLLFIDVNHNCLTFSSAEVRYLALSYVWGRTASFETTKNNFKSLCYPGALSAVGTWNALPTTIRDAIYLTKSLSVRYLWVDRLCIIQDDNDSKKTLLQAMPFIYSNAYFTVVAADGIDANHGLCGISCHRQDVHLARIDLANITLLETKHRAADGFKSPWAYRGWTFQEAIFSKRMLVFNGLVSWVCRHAQYYEEVEVPTSWDDYYQGKDLRSAFVATIPNQKLANLTWNAIPDLHGWRDLVTSYQKRDLTYDSDVLNAFEGVQAALRPGFHGGFIHGLPEMFLDMALLWQPRLTYTRKSNERNKLFPSWSWAGWKSEVDDCIWKKCFNHIYVPLGKSLFDDHIEIAPLVEWRKRTVESCQFQRVDNSYSAYRTYNAAVNRVLPNGWSYDDKEKFYIWNGQHDSEKKFRYPVQIAQYVNEPHLGSYDNHLYFRANIAWLRLSRRPDSRDYLGANLEDINGNWAGVVRFNSEDFLLTPEAFHNSQEFVAISLGCAKILTDSQIASSSIPPDSGFWNTFGGGILEEWGDIQKLLAGSRTYEFYNVLLIERASGIAYRKALGRVLKFDWDGTEPEAEYPVYTAGQLEILWPEKKQSKGKQLREDSGGGSGRERRAAGELRGPRGRALSGETDPLSGTGELTANMESLSLGQGGAQYDTSGEPSNSKNVYTIEPWSEDVKIIYNETATRWQSVLHAEQLRPGQFCSPAFYLQTLLARIPTIPRRIPRNATRLKGYSTWKNSDVCCSLRRRDEQIHSIPLRCPSPTRCVLSGASDFQVWDDTPNSGIILLVLAWAYILNASLAERQCSQIRHIQLQPPIASLQSATSVDLTYASSQERSWWRALIQPGKVFTIEGSQGYLPWTVVVEDLGNIDMTEPDELVALEPPSPALAADYLGRLCAKYGLWLQSSAALATVLTLPCLRSLNPRHSIGLPRLCFTVQQNETGHHRTGEYEYIGYYMIMSLCSYTLTATLESTFWVPNIPCNLSGASLRAASDIILPLFKEKKHELLAKVFSFTRAGPLWLGFLLCGRGSWIVQTLENCMWRSLHAIDVAAWTGIAASFMHLEPDKHLDNNGTISRANVWRLRRDCSSEYPEDKEETYSKAPRHGWKPFGFMAHKDVDLEIQGHIQCCHRWTYTCWNWLDSVSSRDQGFCNDVRPSYAPMTVSIMQSDQGGEGSIMPDYEAIYRVSQKMTEQMFNWCGSQVELGFTGRVVAARHSFDRPPRIPKVTFKSSNHAAIRNWLRDAVEIN
ncbi:heterokaryon incompatibility protein [Seiridium cupressi]